MVISKTHSKHSFIKYKENIIIFVVPIKDE